MSEVGGWQSDGLKQAPKLGYLSYMGEGKVGLEMQSPLSFELLLSMFACVRSASGYLR